MLRSQVRTLGLAGLLVSTASSLLSGQAQQKWVEGPRPVSEAVVRLVEECRCVITYEDPQWDMTEVVDVTERVSTIKDPPRRILGPRTVGFVFPFERPERMTSPRDMTAAVETMLAWHEYAGQKSRFRLEPADNAVHVVPVGKSVLEVPISIAEKEGRTMELLLSLLAELNSTSGTDRQVKLGTVPTSYLMMTKARISADKEPGRHVLARLLGSAGRKVFWQLFYDYTLRFYALNLTFADPGGCAAFVRGAPCDVGDAEKAVLFKPAPQ